MLHGFQVLLHRVGVRSEREVARVAIGPVQTLTRLESVSMVGTEGGAEGWEGEGKEKKEEGGEGGEGYQRTKERRAGRRFLVLG